jgi:hypothetical protein
MCSGPDTSGSAASSAEFCRASLRARDSAEAFVDISRASLLAGASSRYSW